MSRRAILGVLICLGLGLTGGCGEVERPAEPAASRPPTQVMATEAPTATAVATATEAPATAAGPPAVAVPGGAPVTIDGSLEPGEWEGAAPGAFADGSELLLMYSEGFLYLGIRADGPGMIGGNVFVDRGGEIAILHVSAALGTALYEGGDGLWQQTKDFEWCCRSTGSSGMAQAERDDFLAAEGWQAANSRMGTPNELEYKIAVEGETVRLAANFLWASGTGDKIVWPADLDDDVGKKTPGGLPEQFGFSPDDWAVLKLADGAGD